MWAYKRRGLYPGGLISGGGAYIRVYGGPQVLRQLRKGHGKKEKITAKEKSSRQKRKAHGKREKLTAKKKSSRQKRKAHGKKEKLTVKEKSSRQKRKARGGSKNSWWGLWLSLVFGVLHAVSNQSIQRDIHYCSLSVWSCFFSSCGDVAKRTTRGTNSARISVVKIWKS